MTWTLPSPDATTTDANDGIDAAAWRIRAFELKLLELFSQGQLTGTVHTSVGQEYCATALHPHLRIGTDAFFGTHRAHGHYLAHGGPPEALLAELMGRRGALCLGRGGTQNLCHDRFFSTGIQGGNALLATGYAWALKLAATGGIAVAQIGDGTLGEGALYESFTFAALLHAPVLFLLEYNGWAQSTDVTTTTPGDLLARAAGFGLAACRLSDEDPDALFDQLGPVVESVRGGTPHLVIVDTRRLMAHSKGDDDRAPELLDRLWSDDPLSRRTDLGAAEDRARREVDELVERVKGLPALLADPSGAYPPLLEPLSSSDLHSELSEGRRYGRVTDELNAALHQLLGDRTDTIVVGEDLSDPYGGAFKVTRGLSTAFPDRVFSTPIAEAAIVGASNGLALAGMRPIAEIMFSDFVTLAADQLVNFAAKFHYMYGGQVTCPLTVRIVSGGRRGYGPTHSQSLESMFFGVPGLRVVALSQRHDPGRLLHHAVADDDGPTVFVENKALYSLPPAHELPLDLEISVCPPVAERYPPLSYRAAREAPPDVTLVTYGGMTLLCEEAMRQLIAAEELRFDYVILTQLWPLDVTEVLASVGRSRRLVVVEESVATFGIGAAVVAAVAQQTSAGFACTTVGAEAVPIPSLRNLEDQALPSVDSIIDGIRSVAGLEPSA